MVYLIISAVFGWIAPIAHSSLVRVVATSPALPTFRPIDQGASLADRSVGTVRQVVLPLLPRHGVADRVPEVLDDALWIFVP